MARKWLGSFVRLEYRCDWCGAKAIHEYDSAAYNKEDYVAPVKEPRPPEWVTGMIGTTVYHFDTVGHREEFIESYVEDLQVKFNG